MNANELADELQACFTKADCKYVDEAATMLRQQQAEIWALKGGFFDWSGYAKILTDEEIAKVAKDFYLSEYVPYDFVRAILRKAQEK